MKQYMIFGVYLRNPLVSFCIYEPLNRKSSQIVQVAAACVLAQRFWILLPEKVTIKNSMSSVYSRLYSILLQDMAFSN